MSNVSETVAAGFIDSFRDFRRRVHLLAEQLTEAQFWTRPYPYGNSFGNLVLHLTGNLNHYIGAQIADTGYVRERDLEFTETRMGQKAQVLGALDEAVAMVNATLQSQTDDDWARAYRATGVEDVHDRFGIYLRCAVHFHHHIGQMIYLVKAFTQTN